MIHNFGRKKGEGDFTNQTRYKNMGLLTLMFYKLQLSETSLLMAVVAELWLVCGLRFQVVLGGRWAG